MIKTYPTLETKALRIFSFVVLSAALCFGALSLIGGIMDFFYDDSLVLALVITPVAGIMAPALLLAAVVAIERRQLVWFMRVAAIITLLAFIGWLVFVWSRPDIDNERLPLLRAVGTLSLMSLGMVICGQLMVQPTPLLILGMIRVVCLLYVPTYFLWTIHMMWSTWWYSHEKVVGISTVAGGVALCMILVMFLVINRAVMQRSRAGTESIPHHSLLELSCPNCGHEQTLGSGLVRCKECRFTLLIEIYEPRCECGYLIYKLQGDTCPECGRQIRGSGSNAVSTTAASVS